MNITVFGTGFVGSVLAQELDDRGHQVTAVARHPDPALSSSVSVMTGSVHDPAIVTQATRGADVIVSALSPVGDEGGLPASTEVLMTAAVAVGARLGIVGSSAHPPDQPRRAAARRHTRLPGVPRRAGQSAHPHA
ncbi:MAG: uncharacterized protein V7643_2762 [Mycobacterium sp.]|jgi:putative NADH-flavin reductase